MKPGPTGSPGGYASIRREWRSGDAIRFTLPMGFSAVQYTGLDQAPGNVDRYALLRGPILMALDDPQGRIRVAAPALPTLLTPVAGHPLHSEVQGTGRRFVPYWQVGGSYTCYPMVQPECPAK